MVCSVCVKCYACMCTSFTHIYNVDYMLCIIYTMYILDAGIIVDTAVEYSQQSDGKQELRIEEVQKI